MKDEPVSVGDLELVGPIERMYPLGDGKVLVVQLTKEGVVADAYDNDKIVGTFIDTADEFLRLP